MTAPIPPGAAPPAVVELRGASLGYGGEVVVHDLSVRVGRGEVVGLLGANGAGKSTVVRGALGLARPSAGSIDLFGVPLRSFRQWHRVGYVPQRLSHTGGLPATVTEVVRSGRLAHLRPWQRMGPDDRQAVADAIEAVGLTDRARRPVAELSGGQQRRVLIARALATQPDLLVLDEPTAGVDATRQERLADTLAGLVGRGVTILLVAHELGPVAPLVTRTLVLDHGRLVYDGPYQPSYHDHDGEWLHPHGEPPEGRQVGLTGLLPPVGPGDT